MADTFIDAYLRHTSIYESPGSFWRWSAYATIAAVLKDNCYIAQGDSKLFPNVYILFLAESGGRKGKPIDMSESLTSKIANTKIISGRASIQAILDEISRGETDKQGNIEKGGAAIFYAQELSAGIVNDPEAVNILTDIYDYKSNPYRSRLRHGPCFSLDRIVFSMLTGSNEDMLKTIFDEKGKKGGLLARTFLVTPNEHRPPNSLLRLDIEAITKSKSSVIELLREISLLKGPVLLEEDAQDEYEKWYNPFYLRYQKKKEASGAMARMHTGIFKIALCRAANRLSLCINKQDMEESINDCIMLLPNYRTFLMGSGRSNIAAAGAALMPALFKAKNYTLSRKEIIREWIQEGIDFDSEILDKLIVMLEQGGIVTTTITTNTASYTLTQLGVDMMRGKEG